MVTTKGNSVLATGQSSQCSTDVAAVASASQSVNSGNVGNTGGSSWADQVEKSSDVIVARFFLIKRVDGSLDKVSPFLINKALQSFVGDVHVKKLKSGELLVEVANDSQALKIKTMTHIGNIPVTVKIHSYLNTSRGVMSEYELLDISDEEILENLKDQKVIAVRRINIRRDGNVIKTKHVILTFGTPRVPSSIKAGYLRCSIRPFVANPLRCFKCQRFGHSKQNCRGRLTCARCGNPDHESDGCTNAVRCINCKNDHPAYSKNCEKWVHEKEIQTVRTQQNLSYHEARKIVESRTPKVGLSYAAAASSKKDVRNTWTQTPAVIPSAEGLLINGVRQPPLDKVIIASSPSGTSTSKEKTQASTQFPAVTVSPQPAKPSKTVMPSASDRSENVASPENNNIPSGLTSKYSSMIKKHKVTPDNPVESHIIVKQQKRTKTGPLKSRTQPTTKRTVNLQNKKKPPTKEQFLKHPHFEEPALSLHASDEEEMSASSETENGQDSPVVNK